MNLRHYFAVLSLAWLAGCASLPAPDATEADASVSATSPTTTTAPKRSTAPAQEAATSASEEEIQDLWERIRKGFAIPDLDHDLVNQHEQWYSSRPEYIERMTQRSSKYLFHIVEELEQRNMPTELALLPYIESAFNPQAVSSAKAAGMWQFMPATGTYFDLTQNAFRDDRRDVLASTRAALDYLDKLHRMFGDWHLALAAYNWGEGNVGRAIKRNERASKATQYTDLNMPVETRHYVPKLQAVKNIIANPDTFGVELPHIENHPYFQAVDIRRDMDVELITRLADVRPEDFRALNPAFSKPTIFAAGGTQILLPWDNAKVFERNLAAYDDGQFASWTVWVAPSTMTVAAAAQRVGMSESDLRVINKIPPRMLIKAGSALMVPRTERHIKDVASHIADHGRIAFAPEMTTVTRRTTARVQKGDTITRFAQRNGVKVADVLRWNGLKTNSTLRAGQSLSIYKQVRVATLPATGNKPGRAAAVKKSSTTAIKATPRKPATPAKQRRN